MAAHLIPKWLNLQENYTPVQVQQEQRAATARAATAKPPKAAFEEQFPSLGGAQRPTAVAQHHQQSPGPRAWIQQTSAPEPPTPPQPAPSTDKPTGPPKMRLVNQSLTRVSRVATPPRSPQAVASAPRSAQSQAFARAASSPAVPPQHASPRDGPGVTLDGLHLRRSSDSAASVSSSPAVSTPDSGLDAAVDRWAAVSPMPPSSAPVPITRVEPTPMRHGLSQSQEEEERFLSELGWQRDAQDESLTPEEIASFLRAQGDALRRAAIAAAATPVAATPVHPAPLSPLSSDNETSDDEDAGFACR